MVSLSSIKDLVPLDISGRHARKGFSYQDHIAVSFCTSFLTNSNLKEIWLETHEDIMLLWEDQGITSVEFVQVKAVDQTSRWSVPFICGSGTSSDSIIIKLMNQDRCSEPVLFRIVSSYDVNNELDILKRERNSVERNAERVKESELTSAIVKKLGDIKSPNGKTILEWVKLCWWEKKADNINDLICSNKLALESALKILGKPIFSDQRDEIYQKMLIYCQEASTGDLSLQSNCYKITCQAFINWLTTTIDSLYTPSAGTQKLEEKISKAKNVPSDYIQNAKQLKWDYLQKRLSNDFIQPSALNSLESIVHSELFKMKLALDNEEIDEEQFHKHCVDKLLEINKLDAFRNKNIPDFLLLGYI
jgi:hypothetical protein